MKAKQKQYGMLFLILFSILGLYGQNDPRWLIKNENGVHGDTNFENIVRLQGISLPNINLNQNARDDIFVIFEDGDHYNSRPTSTPLFPFNGLVYNSSGNENNLTFVFPQGKVIKYLYLTDNYDTDDPEGITVKKNTLSPVNNVSNLGSIKILSANHDITLNSDIAIIINMDSLLEDSKVISNSLVTSIQYTLKFDKIRHFSGGNFNVSSLFVPKPIFNGIPYQGNVNFPIVNNNQFSFSIPSSSHGYIYIALAAIPDVMMNFLPENNTDINKVIFELYEVTDMINPVASLNEKILHGHDPNHIIAKSICKDQYDNRYVKYELEYENEMESPVSNHYAMFDLPEGLNPNSYKILSSFVGGNGIMPEISIKGQTMKFSWAKTVIHKSDNPESGKVKVSFCIQSENSSFDFTNRIIEPYNGQTVFESVPHSLNSYDETCKYAPSLFAKPTKTIKEIKCAKVYDECNECHTFSFWEYCKNRYWICLSLLAGIIVLVISKCLYKNNCLKKFKFKR